jgi:hypothetical protein
MLFWYQNVNKTVVIQVVPQLDNGPTDEGARLVLKKAAKLEGWPGPFCLFSLCLYSINGLKSEGNQLISGGEST